eukprot:TRINITY_DN874_c1_g1_i1.p1 TRINITY_DN874_c1_g1~~TRINITY_DN874_c1_g1_i1.p1  ORF type:complete len:658 (-),score=88.69 TRINITY_DN874_c1_g1_i1:567-2426(-)
MTQYNQHTTSAQQQQQQQQQQYQSFQAAQRQQMFQMPQEQGSNYGQGQGSLPYYGNNTQYGIQQQQPQYQQQQQYQLQGPPQLIQEAENLLDQLNGSKSSIKNAAAWFVSLPQYFDSLMGVVLQRTKQTEQFEKQIHFIYLLNDILLKSLSQRYQVEMWSNDIYAVAIRRIVGDLFHAVYVNVLQSEVSDGKYRLLKIIEFWQDRQVFDANTVSYIKDSMETGKPMPSMQDDMDGQQQRAQQQHQQLSQQQYYERMQYQQGGGQMFPSEQMSQFNTQYGQFQPQYQQQPQQQFQQRMISPNQTGYAMQQQQTFQPQEQGYGMQGQGQGQGQGFSQGMGQNQMLQLLQQNPNLLQQPQYPQSQMGHQPMPMYSMVQRGHTHQNPNTPHVQLIQQQQIQQQMQQQQLQQQMQSQKQQETDQQQTQQSKDTIGFFAFPPGIIPKLVKKMLRNSLPTYTPLDPEDIKEGIPKVPVMDAYLQSRLDKFYAELNSYRPGMEQTGRCEWEDERDREGRSSRRKEVTWADAEMTTAEAENGKGQIDSETRMRADGSFGGDGSRRSGSDGGSSRAEQKSASSSQYAGLGSQIEEESEEDEFSKFRKMRSGYYHQTMAAAQRAARKRSQ